MIEREVERNEADSRESRDVKLNVKAPSDPHFQLAEVLAHIAVVLAHLAQWSAWENEDEERAQAELSSQ